MSIFHVLKPFKKVLPVCENDVKLLKFDFSATISNINAQFAPVNNGLNSASIRRPNSKVLPVCANDVIEFFKVKFLRCHK